MEKGSSTACPRRFQNRTQGVNGRRAVRPRTAPRFANAHAGERLLQAPPGMPLVPVDEGDAQGRRAIPHFADNSPTFTTLPTILGGFY
jgi:hypothetical protein